MTYFKPKNLGDVRLLLGGIDDNVPVTLTSGVQLPSTVRTVGDLRRLTAWPTKHRLVVERGAPFLEVRVELDDHSMKVVSCHKGDSSWFSDSHICRACPQENGMRSHGSVAAGA